MKISILTCALMALSACAAPSMKASNPNFLTGDSSLSNSQDIKSDLTREDHKQGYYFVTSYPYTEPLIRATEGERSKKNLDRPDQAKTSLDISLKSLSADKTCFMLGVFTRAIGDGEFKFWKAKVEDSDGKILDASILNVSGVRSVPSSVDAISGHGYDWHNNTTVCSSKIDLSKPFKLHIIPGFESFPPAVLAWEAQSKK